MSDYFGIFHISECVEDELHSQGVVTIRNPKGNIIKLKYVGDMGGDRILNREEVCPKKTNQRTKRPK